MAGEAYKTQRKEELTRYNATTNEVESIVRVWAISKGGTRFHIDIPEANLDQAERLLTAKAQKLDAI